MYIRENTGSTLLEMLVAVLVFSIIATAGTILFLSGQSAWTVTDTEIDIQDSLRQILVRGSAELQESGTDKNGVLQVNILNGSGVGGSDILRFAVPICVCGTSVVDENCDVKAWGAPLTWGDSGCNPTYNIGNNGKVDICHLPPGNPENENTLNVSVNAIKAHLAHGDRLGDCDDCDPDNYNNRLIENLLDADGNLLRRVLDSSLNPIASVAIAGNVSDFQVSINGDNTVVTMDIDLSKNTANNRAITRSANIDVLLRN